MSETADVMNWHFAAAFRLDAAVCLLLSHRGAPVSLWKHPLSGTLLGIAIFLTTFQGASAEDAKPPRKVAFLVGINKYQKPNFSVLKYAENDVDAVAAELKKSDFDVTVLKGSSKGKSHATKENIEATLERLIKPLGSPDVIVVMLCGHGQELRVPQESGEKKEEAFFCPVDGVANDAATLVSLSRMVDKTLAPNVGRKMVLVDACRDEPKDTGRGSRGIQGRRIELPEDTAILYSCRSGQRSFELDEFKHGVFTQCVVEGLQGQAARDGEVGWFDLVSHVTKRMSSKEIQARLGEVRQTPIAAGGVEYTVLARITAPSPRPVPKPDPTGKAGGAEGTRAGQERSDNGLKLKLVWCPPGKFTMGSPKTEKNRLDNEGPVDVTLTKGLWLGKYEVTQLDWRRVMRTTPWDGEDHVKEGDNYPATYVSHEKALEFCQSLTDAERGAGRLRRDWEYTLPTVAQWEYACRAGSTSTYSFGNEDSDLGQYGWYHKNAWDVGEKYAHEVGQKKANAWGLHDMHGNVMEWCRDVHDHELRGGTNPEVRAGGSDRVIRGGDWSSGDGDCRSAFHDGSAPGRRSMYLGFRLALSPSGP